MSSSSEEPRQPNISEHIGGSSPDLPRELIDSQREGVSTDTDKLRDADHAMHQAQMLAFGLIDHFGIKGKHPDEQDVPQRMMVMLYHYVHEARKELASRPDVGIVESWLPLKVSDLEPAELLAELRESVSRVDKLQAENRELRDRDAKLYDRVYYSAYDVLADLDDPKVRANAIAAAVVGEPGKADNE